MYFVLLLQKTTEILRNHPIKIDPVPPSTRDGTCLLITVSYFVKVRHARIQKVFFRLTIFLVDEQREDPNTTKSWPSSARQ